jgi:hypothetical protein
VKVDKKAYFELLVRTSAEGRFPSLDQDKIARGSSGCSYRSKNGRACAVGLIIPDQLYKPEMEGRSAYGLFCQFSGLSSIIPAGLTGDDLFEIQGVHDRNASEYDHHGRRWVTRAFWDHNEFVNKLLALPCFAGMEVPQ